MAWFSRTFAAVLLVGTTSFAPRAKADVLPHASRHELAGLRRPVAAAWLEPGRTAVVANRRSGTLSRVDAMRQAVIDEQQVAARISDLAVLDDAGRLLVLDDKSHELVVMHYDAAGQIAFDGRSRLSSYPQKVAVAPDGIEAAVTGLWSRRVDFVALRPSESAEPAAVWNAAFPRVTDSIALPFAARETTWLPDGERLLVADAFGGGLVVVDRRQRRIVAQHGLDAHNLRGLAVDVERRRIVLAGQRLDEHLPTDAQNVGDGTLMKNRLWRMSVERLLDPRPLGPGDVEITELDRPNAGAGDPAAAFITAQGESFVALGGTDQAVIVSADGRRQDRRRVGRRPVALLPLPDGRGVWVVNQLGDSLSLARDSSEQVVELTLGPRPDPYPRDRGEALFFDARLSRNGYMSCHSCHSEGHTIGRRADTLGDGAYGNPKRILSLMGTALTDQWAWNGQLRELRDQVRQSFESTMHGRELRPEQHDDVAAFLHTLPLLPPLVPQPHDDADRQLLERGRTRFAAWDCARCHVGPLTYTSQGAFDVDLRDERGQTKFNPPTLRGVGHGAGFFHDNRATTLEDAFLIHRHQVPDDAADVDITALVRFLRSL